MLALAVPWYVMAEQATPGFLDYFLVGEHFRRFTVSGWEGDLYGNAHTEPLGTIWLFWVYACFLVFGAAGTALVPQKKSSATLTCR